MLGSRNRRLIVALPFLFAACRSVAVPVDGSTPADLAKTPAPDLSQAPSDLASSACQPVSQSDLPGVSIQFAGARCSWTVKEAQAGIAIPYQIVITQSVPNVVPEPQDAGQCARPGSSGLIDIATIKGDNQSWCICDTGRCAPYTAMPQPLAAGTFTGAVDWDGVNWTGPSDFNNPKGPPFPPGAYDVTVSAVGTWAPTNGQTKSFTVKLTLPIQLTP